MCVGIAKSVKKQCGSFALVLSPSAPAISSHDVARRKANDLGFKVVVLPSGENHTHFSEALILENPPF
jgi:hypothetical protein